MKFILRSVLFCTGFTVLFMLCAPISSLFPKMFERFGYGIVGTLVAFVTTYLYLKYDKLRFPDVGLKFESGTVFKFLAGIVIGIIIMGILALTSVYFSGADIEINPNSNFFNFILMTLSLIPLALMEELGFRAYPLEILKDKLGIRLSIFITSILFALYHIANGWTVATSFYGPGVWGLIFGLAAIYSKGIAMPTGIHYALNLTTSAFGDSNNNISIWLLKNPRPVAPDQTISFILGMVVLVLAVFSIEIYIRKKTTANNV